MGRAFIFHMFISCKKTFLFLNKNDLSDLDHDLWPTYLKTLTFAIAFVPIEVGLSRLHMCIPCDETFPFGASDLDIYLWPTYLKTLTFVITFEPSLKYTSHLTCVLSLWNPLNDIKVNGLEILSMTLIEKITILDFVATRGFVFHKHILSLEKSVRLPQFTL